MQMDGLWFSGVRMYVNIASERYSFPAVSGKPKGTKEAFTFDYSTAAQARKDSGPLPSGNYYIDPSEARTYEHTLKVYLGAALSPREGILDKYNKAWGKMPGAKGLIVPIRALDGSTSYSFERDNCWIHGSDFPGSIGCIDMTSFMDRFLAKLPKSGKVPLKVMYGVSPEGLEPTEVDGAGNDVSRVA
jgi:hypothetical protein